MFEIEKMLKLFKKEEPNIVNIFLKYYAEKTKNMIPYSEKLPKWKKIITERGGDIPERTLEQLANSRNIVVITGAGVSVGSGISTYRGNGSNFRVPSLPEIKKNPKKAMIFYNKIKEFFRKCEPNEAHYALKELENFYLSRGDNFILLTQNVDNLHKKAGSKNVVELHGNIFEYKCLDEKRILSENKITTNKNIAYCSCGSLIRPNVVFFGEKIDGDKSKKAFKAAYESDASILVGSSGFVEPVNTMIPIMYNKGVYNIEINPQGSLSSAYVFNLIKEESEKVLPKLVERLKCLQ